MFGSNSKKPRAVKRRTVSGTIVEDGRQIFWSRSESFPAGERQLHRAANKRARLARKGKRQSLRGLTPTQKARRYRHLEDIAARANTANRARLAADERGAA